MKIPEEIKLEEAQAHLDSARGYRRLWTGITLAGVAITGVAFKFAEHAPHHYAQVHGPGAWIGLGTGLATAMASSQIADGMSLVGDIKSDVRSAEATLQRARAELLVQPQFEFED